MPSINVLLFGDQTAEVLPSVERLNAHGLYSPNLRVFLQKSTDGLRSAVARLPASYRRQFPASFESPLELARWAALPQGDDKDANPLLRKVSPALSAALLCIAQLGHVIMYILLVSFSEYLIFLSLNPHLR